MRRGVNRRLDGLVGCLFSQITRNQGEYDGVVYLVVNDVPVPLDSLSYGACLLSNALTGFVPDGSYNLQTRKSEILEPELGNKTRGGGGNALACAARPDPITQVRDVVCSIDVIQGATTKESSPTGVKDDEVILPSFGPRRRAGVKPWLAVRHGIVRGTPRSPLGHLGYRLADSRVDGVHITWVTGTGSDSTIRQFNFILHLSHTQLIIIGQIKQ